MNAVYTKIVALALLFMPINVIANETPVSTQTQAPIALEVTGVVVSHTPRIRSSAIVNDRIWWEGETIRLRKDDNTWVTLTLTKVEIVEGKGGVLTFKHDVEGDDDPTFQVGIKKSTRWGLHR